MLNSNEYLNFSLKISLFVCTFASRSDNVLNERGWFNKFLKIEKKQIILGRFFYF